jgi:hypothetical protein
LAENYEPVLRHYTLNILDDAGTRIAEVEKFYISVGKSPKQVLQDEPKYKMPANNSRHLLKF